MLDHVRTHEDYLCFMLPRIKKLFLEKPGQVLFYLDAALKACVLNLDNGIELLHACYSKHFGRPADFDPQICYALCYLWCRLKLPVFLNGLMTWRKVIYWLF